jgi:group I intron endonuclease
MGYIYLVINKLNGKKYVGQSIQNDINTRWKYHKSVDRRYIGLILYNAYKKHGYDNFEYKIICICFDEDTNKYEKEYIKKYNSLYPNGYNLLEGGENKKHNEYTKKLLSSKLKGINHPNFGKILSEQHVLNIQKSLKKKYEENTQLDKNIHKVETKIKISQKIKEYVKNNTKFYINKYDLNNNLIEKYYSYGQASSEGNINKTYLIKILKSENKIGKGFIWEKVDIK